MAEASWPLDRALVRRREPIVFRGLAAAWPAVRQWSFASLAERVGEVPVQLVVGNRETGHTAFASSTLRDYLRSLQSAADGLRPYLKEFDLLTASPALRDELPHATLLPRRSLGALRSWIGPAGASTGLHYDYLDNLAVQVVGTKRWRLVRPDVVQRLGAVSRKYDSWAVLATASATELVGRARAPREFLCVDLCPGDVLYVPGGWWHELLNVTAGINAGGFFGAPGSVLARWAWVGARDALHRAGWFARGECTCHVAR